MDASFLNVLFASPTSQEENLQEHLLNYTCGWHVVGYICGVLYICVIRCVTLYITCFLTTVIDQSRSTASRLPIVSKTAVDIYWNEKKKIGADYQPIIITFNISF